LEFQRISTIVKMELTRQIKDPLVLVFTTLFVPGLIAIFGLTLGNSYGWGPEYSIFEIMLPGWLAYAGLLTIYDVAAGVAAKRESGVERRLYSTPLSSAEYIFSQMISYSIKPTIQLLLGLGVAIAVGFRPVNDVIGYLLVFLVMVIFSFSSVGFGMITATMAKTAGAAGGLAFVFIVPQQIFGTFLPPSFLGLASLEWIIPSWYPSRLMGLIFAGTTLTYWEIWVRFGLLFAFSVAIYAFGIVLYEKKKKASAGIF
jgi:ABC-type multidrug transport system permease subunit